MSSPAEVRHAQLVAEQVSTLATQMAEFTPETAIEICRKLYQTQHARHIKKLRSHDERRAEMQRDYARQYYARCHHGQ